MKYTKAIIAVIAVAALCLIVFQLSKKEQTEPDPETPSTESTAPAEENNAQDEDSLTQKAEEEIVTADVIEDVAFSDKLHEILLSASEMHSDIKNNTAVISQNGLLYHKAGNLYITPEYLVKRDYLLEDYLIDDAAVLYVLPRSVAAIVPDYNGEGEDAKIYVAAPYNDGYVIDSKGELQAEITKEQYDSLLAGYSVEHGEVSRITESADEYSKINDAIKEYENQQSDNYIRYGMRDDKYAVVITSPKDNYHTINQYVLLYEDGNWTVEIPNLESVSRSSVTINNVFMDLNSELLPPYDLNSYLAYMQTDFSGMTEALISDGYLLEENKEVEYISAVVESYMYAKYKNGQKFVGVFDTTNNIWVLGEVLLAEDASERFKSIDKNAPDFVIIWE